MSGGKRIVVGISDCAVTAEPRAVLVTFALGSCIALSLYDPVARVGGMLHFMLPESSMDPRKAQMNPFMFADSGIPLLFRRACALGARKERLVVRAAGGASLTTGQDSFEVGRRNYVAMRRILRDAGIRVHAEAVGGTVSRTVYLDVGDGSFSIRTGGSSPCEEVDWAL